jgi:hypothetical protein
MCPPRERPFRLPVALPGGVFLCLLLFPISGAFSRTLHVSKSGDASDGVTWETAYTAIGDAIADSTSGDEIRVASGTYHERIALRSGVVLLGGFPPLEVIKGSDCQRDSVMYSTVISASGLGGGVPFRGGP